MDSRGLLRNVGWNVAEVIGSSLVLFIVYRLVIAELGVASLGVWALVLSTTSIARLADLGAAAGLTRFIALSLSRPEGVSEAASYIRTAFTLNLLLYSILGLLISLPASWALAQATSGTAGAEAQALLPYAIASFAMLNLSGVILAALTGMGRSDIKSMLILLSLVVQGAVAIVAVRHGGLKAIALAQIVQYAVLLIGGWLLTYRILSVRRAISLFPLELNRRLLRTLLGFGAKLQLLNVVALIFEPATKFVLSATSGLAALGLYELASRTILQIRQIVVAPSANLVPLYANTLRTAPLTLREVYARSSVYVVAASALAMGVLFVSSPILSLIWLHRIDSAFVTICMMLAVGWFANMAATPAYHLGVASGELRWNVVGSVVMSAGAPLLCAGLGGSYGIGGSVAGVAAALILGGLTMAFGIARTAEVDWLPPRHYWRAAFRQFLFSRSQPTKGA